mmetsp:Transcript_14914/g.40904  ORF Transcript_14914/g.40904 Transcript_14914/m.40904 type:complete len:204 (-) Transcript_14914:472-1083(-)
MGRQRSGRLAPAGPGFGRFRRGNWRRAVRRRGAAGSFDGVRRHHPMSAVGGERWRRLLAALVHARGWPRDGLGGPLRLSMGHDCVHRPSSFQNHGRQNRLQLGEWLRFSARLLLGPRSCRAGDFHRAHAEPRYPLRGPCGLRRGPGHDAGAPPASAPRGVGPGFLQLVHRAVRELRPRRVQSACSVAPRQHEPYDVRPQHSCC